MINQIIDYNRSFVERKGYEPFITDKYPDKKPRVLRSCCQLLSDSRTAMRRLSRTQAD